MENDSAPETSPAETPQTIRPDWLPEKYWDGAHGRMLVETLARDHTQLGERFAKGAGELRKTIEAELRETLEAERLKARPAEASAYVLNPAALPKGLNVLDKPPEDAKALTPGERYALIGPDNAFVEWLRETAFEAGLPADRFAEGMARYAESMAVKIPSAAEAEEARRSIISALGENGQARVARMFTTLKGWLGDDVAALDEVVQSPKALMALERIVERAAGPSFAPAAAAGPAGVMDEATLRAMMRDPRYYRDRDPAFVAKVTKGFQALYPED